MLHLPMLSIIFPQNVQFFYSILLPLSSLDLIPTEYSTELVFSITTDLDEPYSSALEDLGYETHSALLNLGSLFLYKVAMFVCSVVALALKAILVRNPTNSAANKYFTILKEKLFFNGLILLFMEGYFEILISCYLNLYSPMLYTKSD